MQGYDEWNEKGRCFVCVRAVKYCVGCPVYVQCKVDKR